AGRSIQSLLLDVGDKADDGLRRDVLVPRADPQALADGALAGPELASHRLVDQDDAGSSLAVGLGEDPALDEPDAHGLEVVLADDLPEVDVPDRAFSRLGLLD